MFRVCCGLLTCLSRKHFKPTKNLENEKKLHMRMAWPSLYWRFPWNRRLLVGQRTSWFVFVSMAELESLWIALAPINGPIKQICPLALLLSFCPHFIACMHNNLSHTFYYDPTSISTPRFLPPRTSLQFAILNVYMYHLWTIQASLLFITDW